MKPRASMPTTLSTLPRPKCTTVSSITEEKATSSASSGVMSLNTMPCCGKSGTSRTRARRRSMSMGTMLLPVVAVRRLAAAALGRAGRLPPGRLAPLLGRARLLGLASRGWRRRRGDPRPVAVGGGLGLQLLGGELGRGLKGRHLAAGGTLRPPRPLPWHPLALQPGDPGVQLGVARLALLPGRHDRGGDEDRGVGAGGDAD